MTTLHRTLLRRTFGLWLLLLCAAAPFTVAAAQLTVLTHDSFSLSPEVVAAFTEETGITVTFIPAGDAGQLVNRAILTRENPLGDVLYGIDNNLLARAAGAGLFEPYESPLLESVDPRYRFDPEHLVTPIDVGFVNFNLHDAYFAETSLAVPANLTDLIHPDYRSLTVIPNPATSSPGLAFLLTTIARFGEEGWLEFWAALRDNDLLITGGWSDAYYTAFTAYGGDRPIVLSYASSPAAEVMFAEAPLETAPTSNLFCEACVYQQIEAAGILAGTPHRDAAERFIDFMLSQAFQADIPPNMFVYPVVPGTPLPPAFEAHAQVPAASETAALPSETIEANVARWLTEWRQVVEEGRDPADAR